VAVATLGTCPVRTRSTLGMRGLTATLVMSLAATASPAFARPYVSDTFRHRPPVAAMGVDGMGRSYTVANEGTDREATAIIRAFAPDGTLRWERAWRPALASVEGLDVAVTAHGTIAVTGRIRQTDPSVPCDEIWSYGWAVKTWAPDGTALWHRAQPGWRDCEVFGTTGRAVAIGRNSVVVGVQHADEYSASVDLIAFDRDGQRRWERPLRVAGAGDEIVGEIAVGAGGAVYAAATVFVPDLDVEHVADAVLLKRHADGSPAWVRRMPGGSGTAVATLADGVLFGARVDRPSGLHEPRIAVYGFGGDLQWRRAAGVLPAFQRGWPGPWVGSWAGGLLVAETETARAGHARVTLRGFDLAGAFLWRMRLGPTDVSRGLHALGAMGDVIVVAGGRYDAPDLPDRVWILIG
jgi:hypothetical protein